MGPDPVLGITDHDNMSGIVDHHKACRAHGVKPVYGMEVTTDAGNHLTLLAKNEVGLKNLFRLSKTDKSYEDLSRYRTGVVALSGDLSGAIPLSILKRDKKELNFHLSALHNIYRRDFYLEIIDHGLREQKRVNDVLEKIDLPKVRTNDVHFLNHEDAATQSVLICDRLKRRMDVEFATYHTIDKAFLNELPADPVAQEIAEKCNVDLRLGDVNLPSYKLPDSFDGNEHDYLEKLVYEGLNSRDPEWKNLYGGWGDKNPYEERLEYELEVIKSMGFSGYFLIVWDFVAFAHRSGISVGPGRGSGAGSLVAYCLRITDIDPIKHDLLFERFLNPERVSMPDFDIDFCMSRRREVIKYVVDKYGEESVCQIATFSELKPRSSWHSAARVLGVPPDKSDLFSKMLPEPPKDTEELSDIFLEGSVRADSNEKYRKIEAVLSENAKYRQVVDFASKLEGSFRSVGRGAAGVLISNGELTDYIPVWSTRGKDFPISSDDEEKNITKYVSQLDKVHSEKVGLVKFDFLGLAELDVIDYTLELIEKQGREPPDMSEIPLDDFETFKLISEGNTIGVFQLSSDGMAQMVRRMRADTFEDIIAAVALYRPGPMDAGMDEVYIRRKNGHESVDYLHPDLEDILDTTYGVIVYQEQVMQIAQTICGYSLGQADILRRAMGKKKPEEMAAQKQNFLDGGISRGYELELCEELWRQIETFARYGFNRSHAAAYAMISYQTAWLKAHYTPELLAAQMQVRRDDFKEVAVFIEDAKSFGIEIEEPNIQKSPMKFSVRNGKIMVGLAGLKNVNDEVAYSIEAGAPYDHLTEFFSNIWMDKGSYDSLTHAGAFDSFFGDDLYQERADFLAQQPKFCEEIRNNNPDQARLFGYLEIPFDRGVAERPEKKEMLEQEREYLGRYRTGHPVDEYRDKADQLAIAPIADMPREEDAEVTVCAIVHEVSEIVTKNNDLMAFMRLEDETGAIDVSVFPDTYDPEFHPGMEGEVVFATTQVSYYKGKFSPFLLKVSHAFN